MPPTDTSQSRKQTGTRTCTRRPSNKASKKKAPKLSRTKQPLGVSLEEWQVALRRQYGREQNFELTNVGDESVFSEFHVRNPESGNTYRVAVRGTALGENYCSCPDFQTNHLGTCKHIEFTLAQLETKRGGKTKLQRGFHPPYSEVFLHDGAERGVVFRPGTECPDDSIVLAGKYFDEDGLLKPNGFSRVDGFLAKTAEFDHDVRCYEDALRFVAEVRDEDRRRKHLEEVFPVGQRSAHFKTLLRVPLYKYQREGALFAATAGRCLIGDEMGLGKTIQALAAAEIMAHEFGVEKVLIVCPTSLKHQWKCEIEKFTRRTATVIEGLQHQRKTLFEEDTFFKITNYDTVHRDLPLLRDLEPDLVILDEAQRIKNWETRTAQSVKKIESPYAIVLTGTPLENRLEELVSIVQFVDRHRLGPTYRFLHEHQQRDDETGRVIGYKNLDKVGETLEPILVRRKKDDVLDELPERLEKNLFVPMTPEQQICHKDNADVVARIVHKWRRYGFLTEPDQRRLMIALQYMRMSCNSTYLLDQTTDFSVKPDELVTLLGEMFETPETKAVVFSQWTRTHDLIARRLNGEGKGSNGWKHVLFNGSVPSKKRKGLIDEFRDNPSCRLFLSTDAGGVGLNLQHANVVVNMDLPWNPAVLEQRIGRVHRLGQMRPVQVINFIAENTIEQGMLSTLAFKKSLFAGVLDGGEKEVFLGESRLKKFMDTVESVTNHIPDSPPQSEPNEPEDGPSRESRGTPSRSTPSSAGSPSTASGIVNTSDPLAGLIQNGLALLQQLTATAQGGGSGGGGSRTPSNSRSPVQTLRDETTGQDFLKIPMPEPEVLQSALEAVSSLLAGLKR